MKPKTLTRNRVEKREPRGHQEVHVNTLRLESVLPFRLFTEIENEYLLYRREGLPFTQTQRDALLENRIEVLFVDSTEVDRYWGYLREGINTLLSQPGLPLEDRSNVFYESSTEVARQILNGPINGNSLSTARALIYESVKFQHEGKSTLHAIMSYMKTQPNIYHHSLNVCQYGLALARELGFDQQELETFGFGLLLQDLGMLQISGNIVHKEGPLSFEEWDMLRRHPALGMEALDAVEGVPDLARTVVFSHHERLDGSGYPQGLRGEEIGLPVRVATIADVFTSLTTTRPFRTANTTYEAIRIMSQDMASQLDMNVLKVFIQILGV